MISDKLKDEIMRSLEEMRPVLLSVKRMFKEPEDRYIYFPIYLNGVIDRIRYNLRSQEFDLLEVFIADGEITKADWLGEDRAYCTKVRTEAINLSGMGFGKEKKDD